MKISAIIKNCGAISKMPKNKNFGNIFKILFENQHLFCVLEKKIWCKFWVGVKIKCHMRVCIEKMFYKNSPKIYSF